MIFRPSLSWDLFSNDDWWWWWALCILPKHNVPVSLLTDVSKHIIECFFCRVCTMPTQQMRVQPPLTLTGLCYKLQNNSSQSTTTSSPVPVTDSISQIQNTPPLSPTATYLTLSNWQPPLLFAWYRFLHFLSSLLSPPSLLIIITFLSLFNPSVRMLVSAFSNRWGVSWRWRRWSVLGAPK